MPKILRSKTMLVLLVLSLFVISLIKSQLNEFDAGKGTTWQFGVANSSADTPLPHVHSIAEDYPIILYWTRGLYPHIDPLEKRECGNSKCYVTKDRTLFKHKQTRVLYFYGTEVDLQDLPLPRKAFHMWALAHEESPLNNFMLDNAVGVSLFNYTATYHRSADFPLSLLSLPSVEYLLDRNPVSTSDKNRYQETEGLAPIAYVQSHCEVPSDRDRYVQELMRYIKVDSYGKCLHNKDLPKELASPVEQMFNEKFKDLLAKYKFILSFENGICNDYMTEKLFRSMHVGAVPVYRGSPLAQDFMPDNTSIIMVDDFSSPKDLAQHLHTLNTNDALYERYLTYKKRKSILNPSLKEMINKRPWAFTRRDTNYGPFFEEFECHVCNEVSKRIENEKAHQVDKTVPLLPPKITDGRKFVCPEPAPHRKPEDQSDWWYTYGFPEQYWHGVDQARAARDMILAGESNPNNFKKYLKKYSPITKL